MRYAVTSVWEPGDSIGRDEMGLHKAAEILLSLPIGSIVRDGSGETHRKDSDGWRITIKEYDQSPSSSEQMASYISSFTLESVGKTPVLEDIFDRMMDDYESYHLSTDEAAFVWMEVHELFKAYHGNSGALKSLYSKIEREAHKGERCGVCGGYQDPNCVENC